ncbi:MAG: NUDIX domain-containing protein [Clostridia bacterium]|nr:NUDIX domain-containing protein [Clostridia bacterium]
MEKHELVDKNGNKTGKVLTHVEARNLNNVPNGYYISVVGIVIINRNNELLLQKRSKFKRNNPNKWGICGGKVDFGETPLDAGIRETLEEIGIGLNKEEMKFLSTDTNGKLHFTVYYVRKNIDIGKCKLQEEEVDEVKYFKIEELQNLDTEGFEWLESLNKVMEEL